MTQPPEEEKIDPEKLAASKKAFCLNILFTCIASLIAVPFVVFWTNVHLYKGIALAALCFSGIVWSGQQLRKMSREKNKQ